MRKTVLYGTLVICALMVLSGSVVLAADNWNGTWKLDLAKSKFTPPGAAMKSLTLKFEATPGGTKLTADGVDADTASPRKIDDNTYTNTWKKAGKVTMDSKVVVSKDGKSLTVTQSGTNAKGEAVKMTAVYVKQ